jgi:hypothetical protein
MSLGELIKDCVGVAMSIGLVLIVARCIAPIAKLFGVTGRRKRKRQQVGKLETACLIVVVILLCILTANGTMSAMLSSLLSK